MARLEVHKTISPPSLTEFDGEHADLVAKLERYKGSTEEKHKQTWALAQRDEEVRELQKALSDMQVR